MALLAGILFRYCVAGDQWPDPADPLRIDQALLLQLARATLRLAAAKGLVVNASTTTRACGSWPAPPAAAAARCSASAAVVGLVFPSALRPSGVS